MNAGWPLFALACLLGVGAVLAAVAGLTFPPLLLVAVVLGYGSYRLGADAIDRVADEVYESVGVEQNEDGTVGARGEESGWRYVGRVDYEPREEPGSEFAWDDDFWHEPGGGDAATITVGPRTREACEVLGIDPGASREAVRAAYRERVKEVHPDRGGDPERFQEVQWAYDYLRSRERSA